MSEKIMIVDKNDTSRMALSQILSKEYTIVETSNANEAFSLLKQSEQAIVAILIDMFTSQNDGFSLLKFIQNDENYKDIPVVVICDGSAVIMEKQLFEYGVSECISQPLDESLIRTKVNNIVNFYQYKNRLEQTVQEQTKRLQMQNQMLKVQAEFLKKSNLKIIDLLGTMAEYRNLESGEHIQRVKKYTKILAEEVAKSFPEYGLTPELISLVVSASPLHDIGKVAIPDSILMKPGKLTSEEFDYMKSHTISGSEILEKIEDAWSAEYAKVSAEICRHHHERYDGNGYPDRLKGDEIPIYVQVVSIADVYDALVNERVYKAAIPKERAFQMILNGECGSFSDKIIHCFQNCRPAMEAV